MSSPYGAVQAVPAGAPLGASPFIGIQPGTSQQVIYATVVIVSGANAGIFMYNGTPAFGNLVGSWTAQAGQDKYGNEYTEGINIGLISNTEIQIRPDLNAILIYQT
jgi:hypothetical protein